MRFFPCATWKRISAVCVFAGGILSLLNTAVSETGGDGFRWRSKWETVARFYHDVVEYSPYEDTDDAAVRIFWKNKVKSPDRRWSAVVNLEARYDFFSGKDTEKDFDLSLGEAYLKRKFSNSTLSLGPQIVTWGKLDDVILIDRINPQDFSRFVLVDRQERKEAVPLVRYTFYKGDFQVEGIFVPVFYPAYLKFRGSDWAVFGHLVQMVREGGYPASVKSAMSALRIVTKDSYTQRSLKNSEVALRLRKHIRDVDYDFYYMYIRSRIPVLREKTPKGNIIKKFLYLPTTDNLAQVAATSFSGDDLVLEREHPRVHIIGGDFETVAGGYGIRGEAGFFRGMPYLRRDFSYVRKDTISLGVGIDHTTSFDVYWNTQFIETYIFNYEPLFSQEEYSHQVTANLKKTFMDGSLEFAFDFVYNISYGDRMFNPAVTYKFADGLNVTLAAFVFQGNLTTLFGRYAKDDIIYVEIKQVF